MARCVYTGTTLAEAQKIVEGDYSALNWKDNVLYKKAYLKPNPAVADAERAIRNDTDKPAVIEVLIKSEKMLVRNRIKSISGIKSTRIVPEAEILRRTGYAFDREDVSELPQGVVTRASHGLYTVRCETGCYQCRLSGKRNSFSRVQQVFIGDRVKVEVWEDNMLHVAR